MESIYIRSENHNQAGENSMKMFSSSSDMENNSYQSDDFDWNYIPGPYQKIK